MKVIKSHQKNQIYKNVKNVKKVLHLNKIDGDTKKHVKKIIN